MEVLIQNATDYYNYLIYDLADQRSRGYFLIDRPWLIVLIVGSYCYFVLNCGQKWMQNRPPYNIKKFILLFDAFQVLVNLYIFLMGLYHGAFWKFPVLCYGVDLADTEQNRTVIFFFWLYFIVKLTDFMDTIFFVLTKKFNHISFLHVYHHMAMAMVSWGGVKYYPTCHHVYLGIYNTLVHVIMYGYYLITTIYPQKNLYGFKKFVTQMQMYQFLIIFLHMSLVLLVSDCNYPKWGLCITLPNNLMMFVLFYDFYHKTYVAKKNK